MEREEESSRTVERSLRWRIERTKQSTRQWWWVAAQGKLHSSASVRGVEGRGEGAEQQLLCDGDE